MKPLWSDHGFVYGPCPDEHAGEEAGSTMEPAVQGGATEREPPNWNDTEILSQHRSVADIFFKHGILSLLF